MNEFNSIKIFKEESQKNDESFFGFLKWILKVILIIIIICSSIKIIYAIIPNHTKYLVRYNIGKKFEHSISNLENDYNNIILAVNENPNITDEEKDFICTSLKDEIEENAKYIDIDNCIKRLKKLKIEYHKKYYYNEKSLEYELVNTKIAKKRIGGKYNEFTNTIHIYENINRYEVSKEYKNKQFDFKNCNKEVLFHELNHLISRNNLISSISSNKNITSEIINELFVREYFDEYDSSYKMDDLGYEDYMHIAYDLTEILPENIIKEYKFKDDENILISGLLEIDDNIDMAYEFIDSINHIDKNKSQKEIEENYKSIHDIYVYYYENKMSSSETNL